VPELSRSQLVVYGALACVVLLLGARWVRSSDTEASGPLGAAADGAAGAGVLRTDEGDVTVHVAGAVRDPGVYRLPAGARVTDAVERAGGIGPGGAPDALNLAATLTDGQQVVVPERLASGGATAATAAEGPISLGTATVEELDTIEGIGPVTAADIVEFREQNGGIGSIEELDEISGIGPATMESLRASLQP
jgi:competence protein ComEA